MSLTSIVKTELASLEIDKDCCAMAELSALIKTAGALSLSRAGAAVELSGECAAVAGRVDAILKKFYGRLAETEIHTVGAVSRYAVRIPAELTERVLADCQLAGQGDGLPLLLQQQGISNYLVMEECCIAAYLRGAFLGAGYAGVKSGYQLEFICGGEPLADDLAHLLAQAEIMSKKVLRKGKYVVYLKSGGLVCDALALMGAEKTALKVHSEIALREVGSRVNRQNNCISGNISKTVTASVKVAEAIKTIENITGLDYLKPGLKEAAELRLKYPDDPVDALAARSESKITKSGLIHRFNRIIEIAKRVKSDGTLSPFT